MYEEFISASEQSAQLENYKAKTDVLLKKLGESKSQVAQLTKVLIIRILSLKGYKEQ